MGDSASDNLIHEKDQLVNNREQAVDLIRSCLDRIESYGNEAFLSVIRKKIDRVGSAYIDVIKSLDADEALQGTAWLQKIVDEVTGQILALFPAVR